MIERLVWIVLRRGGLGAASARREARRDAWRLPGESGLDVRERPAVLPHRHCRAFPESPEACLTFARRSAFLREALYHLGFSYYQAAQACQDDTWLCTYSPSDVITTSTTILFLNSSTLP
jgi:hypothetical protein